MAFQLIVELFNGVQPIKRKYPIIVAMQRHLLKLESEQDKEKETEYFKTWLMQNYKNTTDRILPKDVAIYRNDQLSICMSNVLSLGTPETIDWFWKRVDQLRELLCPDGPDMTIVASGKDDALKKIKANPMFSEMFDDLQASIDNLNSEDVGSIIETPEFNRLVNTITLGIKSGKYKVTDLTDMVAGIMSVVGDSLDAETKESFGYVLNTLEGVQKGEVPDVQKLMNTLKMLKLQ